MFGLHFGSAKRSCFYEQWQSLTRLKKITSKKTANPWTICSWISKVLKKENLIYDHMVLHEWNHQCHTIFNPLLSFSLWMVSWWVALQSWLQNISWWEGDLGRKVSLLSRGTTIAFVLYFLSLSLLFPEGESLLHNRRVLNRMY